VQLVYASLVAILGFLSMFLVIGYLAYRRGEALTKQSQPELIKTSRPESGRLRSEPKKASDSAWREIPSQREIKRRAGQRRDTGPYYVDEQWQDDAGNWVS